MASNPAQYSQPLPDSLDTVEALEDVLSCPQAGLVEALSRLEGDILILGAGGKVGPTLARMARRAAPQKKIVAVARFSESGLCERMQGWGIETLACDLLDRKQVAALPRIPNIIYMAGKKFRTAGQGPVTWAMNAVAPRTWPTISATAASSRFPHCACTRSPASMNAAPTNPSHPRR